MAHPASQSMGVIPPSSLGIPVNLVKKLVFLWEEIPVNFQYYQTNLKQMAINNLNQVRLHVIPDFVLQLSMALVVFV